MSKYPQEKDLFYSGNVVYLRQNYMHLKAGASFVVDFLEFYPLNQEYVVACIDKSTGCRYTIPQKHLTGVPLKTSNDDLFE